MSSAFYMTRFGACLADVLVQEIVNPRIFCAPDLDYSVIEGYWQNYRDKAKVEPSMLLSE